MSDQQNPLDAAVDKMQQNLNGWHLGDLTTMRDQLLSHMMLDHSVPMHELMGLLAISKKIIVQQLVRQAVSS